MNETGSLTQQVIKRIVDQQYGNLRKLFEIHGWDWQGNQSMNASATLIKEHYGSIKEFEARHLGDLHKVSLFERYDCTLVTSFWRWLPHKAGGWDLRGGTNQRKGSCKDI